MTLQVDEAQDIDPWTAEPLRGEAPQIDRLHPAPFHLDTIVELPQDVTMALRKFASDAVSRCGLSFRSHPALVNSTFAQASLPRLFATGLFLCTASLLICV